MSLLSLLTQSGRWLFIWTQSWSREAAVLDPSPWPPHHVPQPWDSWVLDIQGQDGLSSPHIESVAIVTQKQCVEVSEAFLLEEAEGPVPVSCWEAVIRRG